MEFKGIQWNPMGLIDIPNESDGNIRPGFLTKGLEKLDLSRGGSHLLKPAFVRCPATYKTFLVETGKYKVLAVCS